MNSQQFIDLLKENGYDYFTGVPCSILKNLIKDLSEDTDTPYIPATREDSAVGMAAGAYMAKKRPVILMQNSGLGYCLNALTSLNLIYKIPVLLIVSWRGYLGQDAPEHIIMGDICTQLCEVSGIGYDVLEKDNIKEALEKATEEVFEKKGVYTLFLREDILS